MSEKESNQASLGASDASLPAKNGSRDVEHAPTPLGSEEHSARDDGVATRTRLQTRLQTVAAADILDPSGIAAPQTRSEPTADSTSVDNDGSSARPAASSSLHGVAPPSVYTTAVNDGSPAHSATSSSLHGIPPSSVPAQSSSTDLANMMEWVR